LVRASVAQPRIKSAASIARKAKQFNSTFEKVVTIGEDFVGFRLVCNNLQDVERAAQLMQES
jgi:ppGpp synthetase/RelA/SpoT-type nucleotidyltranferase